MNSAFLDQLLASQSELSPSEQKVATWVLANPAEAVGASIQMVAELARVSQPTVIRFCRSMGLKGYRDLKTQLIASLHKKESFLHHDVSDADHPVSAASKVLENSIDAIVELRKQLHTMPFSEGVQAIVAARQIVFAGIGASGHVAADACHKFFRLGTPCVSVSDSPTLLQRGAISQPGDVFIAISHTGQWRALVDSMAAATRRGAVVLALTDPESPLAEVATILFPCHANEDTNVYTPMSSRLTQLTLLDSLQISTALALGESALTNFKSTKSALTAAYSSGEQQ